MFKHLSKVDIRFKRLIVDEAQWAGLSSDLQRVADNFNVERRFIMTGTPTRNLIGSAGEALPAGEGLENPLNLDLGEDTETEDVAGEGEDSINISPRWTAAEREDFDRIGKMVALFLRILQFHGNFSIFRKLVIRPLMNSRFGSIKVFEQILRQIVLRHRCVTP